MRLLRRTRGGQRVAAVFRPLTLCAGLAVLSAGLVATLPAGVGRAAQAEVKPLEVSASAAALQLGETVRIFARVNRRRGKELPERWRWQLLREFANAARFNLAPGQLFLNDGSDRRCKRFQCAWNVKVNRAYFEKYAEPITTYFRVRIVDKKGRVRYHGRSDLRVDWNSATPPPTRPPPTPPPATPPPPTPPPALPTWNGTWERPSPGPYYGPVTWTDPDPSGTTNTITGTWNWVNTAGLAGTFTATKQNSRVAISGRWDIPNSSSAGGSFTATLSGRQFTYVATDRADTWTATCTAGPCLNN